MLRGAPLYSIWIYSWCGKRNIHISMLKSFMKRLHRKKIQCCRKVAVRFEFIIEQESIPVGCVPPACQPYVFRRLPLIVDRILDTRYWKYYLAPTSLRAVTNGELQITCSVCQLIVFTLLTVWRLFSSCEAGSSAGRVILHRIQPWLNDWRHEN